MKTMCIALFALVMMTVAGWCLFRKRSVGALASGIGTVVLTCLAGGSWREMLIDSGKDATLLGFQRYPAVVVILVMLFVSGMIAVSVGAAALARRNRGK